MTLNLDTDRDAPCLAMRQEQAARALGVSAKTLSKWTADGIVPHVRIGGTLLYPTEKLRAWLNQHAARSATNNAFDALDGMIGPDASRSSEPFPGNATTKNV